jgi:hypothetical protein
VFILVRVDDRRPTENDEVAFIVNLHAVDGCRRDLVVIGVGCAGQQFLQREQPTGLPRLLLAIDLLEAQDISLKLDELRLHHRYALGKRWRRPRPFVEVFQVNRGNTYPHWHELPPKAS